MLMSDKPGIKQGDPERADIGVAIGTSTPNRKPPAVPADEELAGVHPVSSVSGSTASVVLPSYPVGRKIALPFGQLLPLCEVSGCDCRAVIVKTRGSNFEYQCVVCLDHGLEEYSKTRDLVLRSGLKYHFISPEHEAAIRASFA